MLQINDVFDLIVFFLISTKYINKFYCFSVVKHIDITNGFIDIDEEFVLNIFSKNS